MFKSNPMSHPWVVYVLLSCVAVCLYGQENSKKAEGELATLSGTVLDRAGSVLIDNTVVLTDADSGREAATAQLDSKGRYRLVVRAGRYRISLANTRDILPYSRAAFRLEQGDHTLNLWPAFRSGVALGIDGDRRLADPQVRVDSRVSEIDPEMDLVIRYEHKRSAGGLIEYTGEYSMFSIGLVTIRANQIQIDDSTSFVKAEGKVEIYIDQYHISTTYVELNPRRRMVRLSVQGEIIERSF